MSKVAMTSVLAVPRPRFPAAALTFTEVERNQVLDHLEEIFLSPAFRNSKRNCALLRYVVERTLDGLADQLKERTIGVEAFGRQPDYDTNVDHSVRSAAGEVRRRLAQYYMEQGDECGIRIELLPGSYIPQIRFLDRQALAEEVDSTLVVPCAPPAVNERPEQRPQIGSRVRERIVAVGAVAALLAIGLAFRSSWQVRTPFEQLWNPILASPNTALLCFGGGRSANTVDPPATVADFERLPSRHMNVSDAMALVAVTGTLRASGKDYRILSRANSTSYKDLQQGPFILIGGLNNEWTLRLTEGLRFTYQHALPGEGSHIADRKNPGNTSWSFRYSAPFSDVMRDYAIVTRLRDPKTEQVALIVAGLGSWGTQAAAEFVSNPNHVKKLERLAPRDWQQKNLQVVIATDIIRGSSGPPAVLAAEFW
jgi:hypothetical protein